MRKFIYLLMFCVLVSFSSCFLQNLDENTEPDYLEDRYGVVVKMPPLWTLNHRTNENDFGNTIEFLSGYNNSIFLTGYESNSKKMLKGVNVNTGKIKWKQEITDNLSNAGYAYNDYLALPYPTHIDILSISTGEKFYSIDKKIEFNYPFAPIAGLKNDFYFSSKTISEDDVPAIYKAQFGSNVVSEIFKPKQDTLQNKKPITIHLTLPFSAQDSEYLFISYVIDGTSHYTCLYNQSDSSFVYYTKVDINDAPTGYLNAKIDGTDIYLLSISQLTCMDILSQKVKWAYKVGFESPFRIDNLFVNDQLIFITQGGYTPRTIAIYKQTGGEIWTVPTGWFLSPYQELNGMLYFVSYDYLFAIDSSSGVLRWKLDAPDDSGWYDWCIAVPGVDGKKGKIIANTRAISYCFEAIE